MSEAGAQAHAALRGRLDAVLAQADGFAAELGDALLSVAGLLDSRPSVRRALTDTGRTPDDREALVRQLISERIPPAAAGVVVDAVRDRWATPSELASAIENLGVLAHLMGAASDGRLESVEDEVFRFGQVVRAEPELRSALLDRSAPGDTRQALVRRLLEGKASPATVRLVEHAILDRRSRSLEAELDRYGELAAQLRQRRVAVVRVAAPLSQEHHDRLERALATQAGGPVLINVVVEPGLVGGIKVEIGDEVVDGTVMSRLDDARRQLSAGRRA